MSEPQAVQPSIPAFRPVLLGGDIGTYALARSFREAYGVRPVVAAEALTGAIGDSGFIDYRTVQIGQDVDAIASELLRVADSIEDDAPLLLLTNSDWYAHGVALGREALEARYRIPMPALDVLDRVSDKQTFNAIAGQAGMSVPATVSVDFASADDDGWSPDEVSLRFPVIAKPAISSYYQTVHFDGKKKIYVIDDREHLESLWRLLRAGGFRGTFLVQEMIPGDDTAMWSITAYADRDHRVTLLASAQVLLEDHTPAALGIPVAMITRRRDDVLEQARRFLEIAGYQGFANFDLKIDPRDGTPYFFEVNPRIGRNNYYVTAGGVNPAAYPVADVIEQRSAEPIVVEREALYTTVPRALLERYLPDALRQEVERLTASGLAFHPLASGEEHSLRRRTYVAASTLNHWRKFLRYYPQRTDSGF